MAFLNNMVTCLKVICVWGIFVLSGCSNNPGDEGHSEGIPAEDTASESQQVKVSVDQVHPLEQRMIDAGMVNVQSVDSSIVVDMKYASEDNFMGSDLYDGMDKAYLQPDVALMLAKAQEYLKQDYPSLSLIVYDAARPRSVQQQMWDAVDATFEEKIKFLSNPANGSVHNFGAAVDVGIIDNKGHELDMGTPFDHMGELAYPSLEKSLLTAGELSPEQKQNRKLLRQVMQKAGFSGISTEWWHFNAMSRSTARQRYEILE